MRSLRVRKDGSFIIIIFICTTMHAEVYMILYILVHQCVLKKVFAGESAGERCLSSSTSEEEEVSPPVSTPLIYIYI